MAEASTTKPTIGFIGLGNMGSRMASRLLEAGFPLGIYNRSPEKIRPLAAQGAAVYDSPRELAQHADVVLSSVSDDAAVEQVLIGADGALAGARPGATLIDLSSVHPDTSRKVAAAAAEQGVAMLDAAVSGSTVQAEEGSRVMFVGGGRNTYERCQPIFDVIGATRFYIGPSGSGATMKLVANTLLGVGMQAVAEAITLGERAGLDKDVLLDVLDHTRVIAPVHQAKLANARSEDYPVAFPLRLMWKDLGNVLRLAQERQTPMPVTAAAQQVFAAEQAKRIEEDFSAVIRITEELAGVPAPGHASL
jgi:3-hydroxyisobutyrate dehydrogenase-like beta-hydroxyacid dehydrogenase